MWRRSSRTPAVSGALRLVSLPRIVHQHGAFAHGRAAAHSKRQHAITAGTRESPTRRKSAKRRDARRPRKRRTAHRRGRSDWPTTASCHLPHGANEGTSERARKRIMRPAHVVPLAPMRPGCSLAGRGARVRESGRASKRHARPRAPSCTATASHAVPPIPPVAAPAEGLGRTSQRAWLLQQNYAHDAVTAQWSAAASPASPGAILLVEHAPVVAEACGVSGCVSE